MSEILTIQSAPLAIDVDSVRQTLRNAIPLARYGAGLTSATWDDAIVDGLEAFVESDHLWAFFKDLLGSDDPPLVRAAMEERPEIAVAAERAGVDKAEFIEYLPAIIALAKALIQLWQSHR